MVKADVVKTDAVVAHPCVCGDKVRLLRKLLVQDPGDRSQVPRIERGYRRKPHYLGNGRRGGVTLGDDERRRPHQSVHPAHRMKAALRAAADLLGIVDGQRALARRGGRPTRWTG